MGETAAGIEHTGCDERPRRTSRQTRLTCPTASDHRLGRIEGSIRHYESGKFVLDVGLWDAATLRPVWRATTESYTHDAESEMHKGVSRFVLDSLSERGFISF